jgi:Zn-dependent peptidase ImmA (M78 family)/DNA-binding XRE family transcriptional regulator
MKSGVSGFEGSRLREAREVRGVPVLALAESADVTRQVIYQYELNNAAPSVEVLSRISNALGIPEKFFITKRSEIDDSTLFFRSMASTTKVARARATHRLQWLQDIVNCVSEYVELPDSDFPSLNLPADPLLISDEDIDDAAEQVRTFWKVPEGPIANIVALLEHHGAIVARDALGAESLDGLSGFFPSVARPIVLVGIDKGSPVRWRFDAAHELGHLILHSHVAPSLLRSPENYKRIEDQAHRFAGAFILPCASFGEDLYGVNLDNLLALKLKWKISIAAMVMRARQCGLLSEDTERRIWINISRRGWRKNEPYDDSMPIEEPRMLRAAIDLILTEGGQTPDEIVDQIGLPERDIEVLCGLSQGYFAEFSRLTLRRPTEESVSEPEDTVADVIPIRPRRRNT